MTRESLFFKFDIFSRACALLNMNKTKVIANLSFFLKPRNLAETLAGN